jgi:hypothetical protein
LIAAERKEEEEVRKERAEEKEEATIEPMNRQPTPAEGRLSLHRPRADLDLRLRMGMTMRKLMKRASLSPILRWARLMMMVLDSPESSSYLAAVRGW